MVSYSTSNNRGFVSYNIFRSLSLSNLFPLNLPCCSGGLNVNTDLDLMDSTILIEEEISDPSKKSNRISKKSLNSNALFIEEDNSLIVVAPIETQILPANVNYSLIQLSKWI